MAGLTYPTVLVPEAWNKQKGVQQKATGMPEALKALSKAHDAIDMRQLEVAKLGSSEGVQERIDELGEMLKKSVKTAVDQAKNVVAVAKKAEGEYKKVKDNSKEATAAAVAVGKAASDYQSEVVSTVQTVIDQLTAKLAKLEAEEKKNAKNDKDDEAESADEKFVRNRVISALRIVKTAKPDAKPMLFMIGMGKLHLMPYLWYSVGASHRNMLTRLMAGDSGFKFFKGECIFEQKAFTFVGETIPGGGFAKKLQKGLFDLTNVRYRVRTRKPDGDAEEEGGEDEDGDKQVATTQDAKGKADPGAEFNQRLAGIQAKLREAMAGPQGDALKKAFAAMSDLAQKRDFATAGKRLNDIEALLANKATGAAAGQPAGVDPAKAFNARFGALLPRIKAASGDLGKEVSKLAAAAGNAAGDKTKEGVAQANSALDKIEKLLADAATAQAGAASGGDANKGLSVAKLGKARLEWVGTRTEAVSGIDRLIEKIKLEYKGEDDQQNQVQLAIDKLNALSAKLKVGLEAQLDAALNESDPGKRAALAKTAKATLLGIAKLLTEDPLMAELDGNELLPDLKIVAPMKTKLRDIAAALG